MIVEPLLFDLLFVKTFQNSQGSQENNSVFWSCTRPETDTNNVLFIKHPHRNNYTELSVHERDDHGTDLDHGTRCALLGFGVTDPPRWTAEYHDQDQSILKLHHYRMILKTDGVMNLVPFEKHGRNS